MNGFESLVPPEKNRGAVYSHYQSVLKSKNYLPDAAQIQAIAFLDQCAKEWQDYAGAQRSFFQRWFKKPAFPQGVYLYGGVGRGKSVLMDCFFEALPFSQKKRLHFHEFMQEVHRQLHLMKETVNPLDVLVKKMRQHYQLLCFDEFHIADVTDAMILHRLLQAMFRYGIGFVTTSNFHPSELYPDGLHRDRILPAIDLLEKNLHIVQVDTGKDYRQQTIDHARAYRYPLDAHSHQAFEALLAEIIGPYQKQTPSTLMLQGRLINVFFQGQGVLWVDFQALCAQARSPKDYLDIADQFDTVLLSNVPQMSERHASQARRLTWLVDVLYDRKIQLFISAEVAPEALYLDGPMAHEFPRTVSRLIEMQTLAYRAQHKREVNTSLT